MRSGNGTANVQTIYVLVNVPFVWCWKIGITGNLKIRTRQNSKRVPGTFFVVAFARIPFAYQIEQLLLSVTRWSKTTVLGTGGTEIRWFFTGIPAAVFVWMLAIIKWIFILMAPVFISWICAGSPKFWK